LPANLEEQSPGLKNSQLEFHFNNEQQDKQDIHPEERKEMHLLKR
jgi:hypothetical protein